MDQDQKAPLVVTCGRCRLEMITTHMVQRLRCSRCNSEIPLKPAADRRDIQNYYLSRNSSRTFTLSSKPKGIAQYDGSFVAPLVYKPWPGEYNEGKRGRKKAVVCGITYKKKYKLKGALTDVYKMRDFLQHGCGFPEQTICILSEDGQPERMPTKSNIERCLRWLVDGCKPGDSLVFYFSGHGVNQPDYKNDELDHFDELLCPVDFETAGMILDDDLNSILVRPLPKGVMLHAIVDTCHSGTILDLPWVFDQKRNYWKDNRPPSGVYKGTNGGLAISFSACLDNQIAADTSAFSKKGMSGAMTHCFIQAVQNYDYDLTYYQLLVMMYDTITQANASKCCTSHLLDRFFQRDFFQEPLLSSSEKFDVQHTKFKL